MRKYGLHSFEVDSVQVKEDDETLIVPAVITREGVYDYDGMLLYEPAEEIEKAALTATKPVAIVQTILEMDVLRLTFGSRKRIFIGAQKR